MCGDRSFSFVGPDSWIDCQAAPSVLKSLLVTGITVALKVADMAAFMSSVGGMRRFLSMSPPRQIKGMIGQPQDLPVSLFILGNMSTSHVISSSPGKTAFPE